MKYKTPKLIPLDMKKANESTHPDINLKKRYLIRFDNEYYVGYFSKVWFGLSFDGWHAPLQFDAPGYNSSSWQQIWEMK